MQVVHEPRLPPPHVAQVGSQAEQVTPPSMERVPSGHEATQVEFQSRPVAQVVQVVAVTSQLEQGGVHGRHRPEELKVPEAHVDRQEEPERR